MTLGEFRAVLENCCPDPFSRPLVCNGSPLDCRIFIVGLNAAHRLSEPFSAYWDDTVGFNKPRFLSDYLRKKGQLRGVRRVIEWIVEAAGQPILEANIYTHPTRRANQLRKDHKKTDFFEFLMDSLRPEIVFAHSNKPIKFFEKTTDCSPFPEGEFKFQTVTWNRLKPQFQFQLLCRRGPLWRTGRAEATSIGRTLAHALNQPAL